MEIYAFETAIISMRRAIPYNVVRSSPQQ